MRTARPRAAALVDLVGLSLLAAGPVMLARALDARTQLRAELESQRIDFPEHPQELPPALRHLAGRRVRSGGDARAFSDLIKSHLDAATGGRTYAEITAEYNAAGCDDEKLANLRQTAFTGQALRSGLMGAYQAANVTALVAGLGVLTTGIGAGLLALAHGRGATGGR